jgi:hypothetical protein
MTISQIVKHNTAVFSYYRNNVVFYEIVVNNKVYMFPISLEDVAGCSLFREVKAITLMRWIRKALEDQTFVLVGNKKEQ